MPTRLFTLSILLLCIQCVSKVSYAMETDTESKIAQLEHREGKKLMKQPFRLLEKCSYHQLSTISRERCWQYFRKTGNVNSYYKLLILIAKKREQLQISYFSNEIVAKNRNLNQPYQELRNLTPLVWATGLQYINALPYVKQCIAAGADVNFFCVDSPLTHALINSRYQFENYCPNIEAAKLLTEHGAHVCSSDVETVESNNINSDLLYEIISVPQLSSRSN